jgi:hypothetical protein
MLRISLILVTLFLLAEMPVIAAQKTIEPGSEWSKTRHLKNGDDSFQILFARSGWETQQSGNVKRSLNISNDTIKMVRETTRGKYITIDTLWMNFPSLIPIAFNSNQKDRFTNYSVKDDEIKIHIDFVTADVLDFSQSIGPGFYDVSTLELVLGGLKRKELKDRSVRLFDPQTSSFIYFTVNEVNRERIEDANGNRHRCFLITGKLNQAEASFWVHRRSGELIKSKLELNEQMAMILLRD